jgi:hypothetical protein
VPGDSQECRAFSSGFRFAFVSLENNISVGDLVGTIFWNLCLLVGTGGAPPYFRSFGMNTLAAIPARSLGNKDLEVKYLLLKDLAWLLAGISAFGLGLFLHPGVGSTFRPDQKVKLDKTMARRGGLFLRRGLFGL